MGLEIIEFKQDEVDMTFQIIDLLRNQSLNLDQIIKQVTFNFRDMYRIILKLILDNRITCEIIDSIVFYKKS